MALRGLDKRVEARGSDHVIEAASIHRRFWMLDIESRRIIELRFGIRSLFIPVTFCPFGRAIVSIEEAERRGLPQQAAMPS